MELKIRGRGSSATELELSKVNLDSAIVEKDVAPRTATHKKLNINIPRPADESPLHMPEIAQNATP
jgi:hypothetical protein